MDHPVSPTTASAGRLFGQTLARLGVLQVFAIVGSHINQLLAGCEDAGIEIIDTRHEAIAGHAVEGYAKTAGRPGVCIATAGPGFTNTLTAMMSCYVDGAPALFVAGAAPLRNGGPNPLQGGFSQLDMARPVAKWVASASQAAEIPGLLEQGWAIAGSGRPGPVFIEIPADVAQDSAPLPLPEIEIPRAETQDPAEPTDEDIDRVLRRIEGARKPLLVAGGGVKYAGAYQELRRFAEATGLPVLTNFDSHGVLPADSRHWCGSLNLASRLPEAAECDLLVVLGARFGLLTGGIPGRFSNPELTIIQVDIHPEELEHLRPGDLGIAACCGDVLRRLNQRLAADRPQPSGPWLEQLHAARAAATRVWARRTSPAGMIHPYHLAKCVVDTLPRQTRYVVDGGDAKHWLEMNHLPEQPGQYLSRAYSGALGSGQGLALGIHYAKSGGPICLFIGDGAWGFQLQAVDTYIRHGVPVITVVVNNGCWGSIKHIQQRIWPEGREVAVDLGFSRYDRIAEGFGCPARRVYSPEGLAQALRDALAEGRPYVIDAIADPGPDPLSPPVSG